MSATACSRGLPTRSVLFFLVFFFFNEKREVKSPVTRGCCVVLQVLRRLIIELAKQSREQALRILDTLGAAELNIIAQ